MERTATGAEMRMRASRTEAEAGSDKRITRIEALSDGVFSIALTLLIMDVVAAGKKVADGRTPWQDLLHEWPAPVSYLVGFLAILVCRVNQQKVFHYMKRADHGAAALRRHLLAHRHVLLAALVVLRAPRPFRADREPGTLLGNGAHPRLLRRLDHAGDAHSLPPALRSDGDVGHHVRGLRLPG
jgi:hypothetical protein